MGLDPAQHSRISLGYYPAGHMMYIQDESLSTLRKDVGAFLNNALK
jgi:carboxypeptidase C (cathepsin A)